MKLEAVCITGVFEHYATVSRVILRSPPASYAKTSCQAESDMKIRVTVSERCFFTVFGKNYLVDCIVLGPNIAVS
jgi:hypothetical protein